MRSKNAHFSTKNRCFLLNFTYLERSEPIRRTLWWSFRPICLLTLYKEKSCPYLPKWKYRSFKNWKMHFFSKLSIHLYFMIISIEDKIFFYKTIVVQNSMKILIYFISFCLTCILNVLHPDYQNSKVRNSLYSCCFPDFTHSKDFF